MAPLLPVVTSVYVWGNEREEVNRVARRVAARIDPNYLWLRIADGATEDPAGPGARTAELPPPAFEFAARPKVSEERLWSYLKARGQREPGRELLEFVQWPEVLQESFASLVARDPPRVLALGNSDLIPAPTNGERARIAARYIEFLNRHDVTLLVGHVGRPGPERIEFEYSIAAPGVLPNAVRGVGAVCQWGECSDCIVNRVFPPEEVVCISRLASGRSKHPDDFIAAGGFAWH